ncbi:ABC transporter ATP-binding protein/permease [Agrobacterium vitis]|uniref:ABC transporter ATP-binding protein/permease n=1 Tax=Agrobacterium vitis TaxID=373 RepID=A0A368NRK4_AGRVI|nr:ABC transporter ATP-binding protein/permease [Agrobacterium vitis]KAA3516788.1 ABC transporter ATP-binding protein/permease [Agrobacterium vitis]KAA3529554.1 ABC transporter ATP-binding protein/permease [Agrobacterium vitis]MCF1477454.1 ABC transporter ATP-binding protein/permease [Agrobacterium vitis]MUZ97179.1 ABC transporter ATP-binding protein/permease [Agrobacterium vitis]MVA28189.1 ABC transporter ATP-binding protein/permease [Agrobacterium vitis]
MTASKTTLPDNETAAPDLTFAEQMRMAGQSFWSSHVRGRILLLALSLLAVILLLTYGQILLNRWNQPFYNALENRDLSAFWQELRNFFFIAAFLLVINVAQTFFSQMTALYMREGLARDMVDQWLKGRRAYRLSVSSPLGVNPDQRLHEDARKLAESTTSLTVGLVQSTILLVSFISVLWKLSGDFSLTLFGHQIAIPGYMVWAALIYAGGAAVASNLVGATLTRLNATRYAREAELRAALMRSNEHLEPIALARGEDVERGQIHSTIDRVLAIISKLALALTNLTWVSAAFGWLALIVPVLIASPAYFGGTMTFGGLMMAASAFTQVYTALRWYVDNFGAIADWKATLLRVMVLRAALIEPALTETVEGQIRVEAGKPGELAFEDVYIRTPVEAEAHWGGYHLKEDNPTILAGEHVMVNGDPGINRRQFFNAIAGLWPYGEGLIRLPQEDHILFVPQSPYMPEGRLRDILAYPEDASTYGDEAMTLALKTVKLSRLASALDERQRWDRVLDKDEQMALAFAHILLRKPRWVVFNDVLDGVEPETATILTGVMTQLEEATLIYIGRAQGFIDAVSPRILHLERMDVPVPE